MIPFQWRLKVNAIADKRQYEKGLKISDEEINSIKLKPDIFRGDWNYSIQT